MTTPIFRFAKKNDDVWDLHLGWGKIINVKYAAPYGSNQFVANFDRETEIIKKIYKTEGKDIETGEQTACKKGPD